MGIFQKLFGKTESSNLAQIKCLLREAEGARDFLQQAEAEGFSLVDNTATHIMYGKDDCRFTMGAFASTGSDTIWFVSAFEKKGSGIIRLVEDGKLMF